MRHHGWKAHFTSPRPRLMSAEHIFHPRRIIPSGMTFAPWTAADGWTLRSFAWPTQGACRGSMLFLPGRGDFIEKYIEALSHWHSRGWSLAGLDWRGQGGSGRLLADPLICHQRDFDVLVADLAHFVGHWLAHSPAPHVIVAHSMGAHLALRLLGEGVQGIDAVVLASPMIDFRVKALPGWALELAANAAGGLGWSERKVWGHDVGDFGGRRTSCPERREDKAWWTATRPDIASGPPSWGWVRAARRSIRRLTPAKVAAIRTPALVIASESDPIVDVGAIARTARLLPDASLMMVEGTGHELLREADSRRLPVLARIDGFLDCVAL